MEEDRKVFGVGETYEEQMQRGWRKFMEVDKDKLVKLLEESVARDISSGIILASTLDYISPETEILIDILGQEAYKEAWDKARAVYPPGDVFDILGVNVERDEQYRRVKESLLNKVEERRDLVD